KKSRSRRRSRSKTALVLGGGGFTGAVYEIGALRAFDLLAVNRTVNDFDVYVGTSAGSFVGSAVANGVTPEEMMRVLNKHLPSPLRDMDLGMLLRPNYKGFASAGLKLPFRLAGITRDIAPTLVETSVMELAHALAGGPSSRRRSWTSRRRWRPASRRASTPATGSRPTSPRCWPTPIAPTTSGCSPTSSTSARPRSTRPSGSSSATRSGATTQTHLTHI